YSSSYGGTGTYMAGSYTPGSYAGNSRMYTYYAAQREYERLQRDATAEARYYPKAVKDAIGDQWAYEKQGVLGPNPKAVVQNQPEQLVRALAVTDEQDAATGEARNQILMATIAAESKGAKGPSAFLPPQVLDEVRFSGSPAADALNYLRQASNLPFPAAFGDPKLKDARDELERDFTLAAAPLLAA